MNKLFGISMDVIMYVLLVLLLLSLLSVAYVALRNRIMFKMGLRNIPRRRAQTTLIVIGLMLSTLIISAAFTTGDTVDRSLTSQVYSVLGQLDEIVELGVNEDAFDDPTQAALRPESFPRENAVGIINSLQASEAIEYAVPVYTALAVGINPQERLSSPEFNIVGLDPEFAGPVTDIQTLGGTRLSIDDLGPNELFLNESAADDLNATTGSTITVAVGERTTTFTVREVVRDRRFAGSGGISVRREGAVMPLAAAQALFDAQGQVTSIFVSNVGDARSGYSRSEQAQTDIEAALTTARGTNPALARLDVNMVKQTGVDIAELSANFLTTIFIVFGLFSIGAGVLLIFLIFVMLAAERKSEMGMARAIGTRRLDLVQTFLSEGMAYNVLAAAVGAALGVLVSFIISRLMAQLFESIQIEITPYVTPRSLIVSYCLGVVLTFFTVTFSSWRVSNINIVRAIRDIPEPPPERPAWGSRGFVGTVGRLIFKGGSVKSWLSRIGLLVLGVVVLMGSGASGVTALQIIGSMIGFVLLILAVFRIFQMGFMFVVIGIPLIILGDSMGTQAFSAFVLASGLSLTPLGLAFIARSLGANPRLVYTAVGLFLIYLWELDAPIYDLVEMVVGDMPAESLLARIFGETSGDIEMFFLSGVMVTLAATFLVVYNADIILAPLNRIGSQLGTLLPTLKMAIAYPLANRMRTGMTMAMFCLVVFALTVMSSLSHNFERIALSDASLGGWDLEVQEHPSAPLEDLQQALGRVNSPVLSEIDAVGKTSIATRFRAEACEPRANNTCDPSNDDAFTRFNVNGVDSAFLNTASLKLQNRANGYADDAAVLDALASQPNLAVVDAMALVEGSFGAGFIEQIRLNQATFEPVTITLRDSISGRETDVTVIGVIDANASLIFTGIFVTGSTFEGTFGAPDASRYFVKTAAGTDNREAARQIESALLESGVQSQSLRAVIEDFTAVQLGFFRMIQGFMGLGLVVGVAAVGVIAFRTVVERRQQIGMLRAIGYTRGMVGLTFLIESAFIAFMGILSGLVFALILAWQLITEEFTTQGSTSFSIPWFQLVIIAGFAFGFALIMTLLPSRQAAKIPIAEALRYE